MPVDAAVYLVHRAVQGHARESFVSRDDFLVCQMEALGAAREAFNTTCRPACCLLTWHRTWKSTAPLMCPP